MIVRQKGDIQVGNSVFKITLHKFRNPSYHREGKLARLLQYADNWCGGVVEESKR